MQQLADDKCSEGHQQDESGNVGDAAEGSCNEAESNYDLKPRNDRDDDTRNTKVASLCMPIWTHRHFRNAGKYEHRTDAAGTQPRNEFGAHEVNLVGGDAGDFSLEKHQCRFFRFCRV